MPPRRYRAYCLQVIRSTPLKPCISCRDAWYLECDTLLGICSALPTVRGVIDLGLTQAVSRGSCETPRASMLEYCALVPKYVGERSSFNCRRSLPELSEARQLGPGHTEKLSCSSCFARTRHERTLARSSSFHSDLTALWGPRHRGHAILQSCLCEDSLLG